MCLTYLRLFLVKLYFCVPARVAINIKKQCYQTFQCFLTVHLCIDASFVKHGHTRQLQDKIVMHIKNCVCNQTTSECRLSFCKLS